MRFKLWPTNCIGTDGQFDCVEIRCTFDNYMYIHVFRDQIYNETSWRLMDTPSQKINQVLILIIVMIMGIRL